jgi:hypothetical protein
MTLLGYAALGVIWAVLAAAATVTVVSATRRRRQP